MISKLTSDELSRFITKELQHIIYDEILLLYSQERNIVHVLVKTIDILEIHIYQNKLLDQIHPERRLCAVFYIFNAFEIFLKVLSKNVPN